MKIRLQIKDPNFETSLREAFPGPENEATRNDIISANTKYGEYLTIEIDTKTLKAVVVQRP